MEKPALDAEEHLGAGSVKLHMLALCLPSVLCSAGMVCTVSTFETERTFLDANLRGNATIIDPGLFQNALWVTTNH